MKRLRWPMLVGVALLVAAGDASAARKDKKPRTEDLVNIYLGIDNSRWLIGPIYFIASEEERKTYLALTSDTDAERFVREFWKRRDPEPDIFGNPALRLFEERAEIADRHYREQVVRGRQTDRGALFVLHGEPELIYFDPGTGPRQPDVEVWIYPKDAPPGLDGRQPERRYYFAERDGQTVFYRPRANRRIEVPQ